MAIYEKKIRQYSQKVEQIEKRMREDTAELKRLRSEIIKMRYLSLCAAYNCGECELETILTEEHKQLGKLREQYMDQTKKITEDKNESKIF